jgi:hypothetical protein
MLRARADRALILTPAGAPLKVHPTSSRQSVGLTASRDQPISALKRSGPCAVAVARHPASEVGGYATLAACVDWVTAGAFLVDGDGG